MEGFLQEAFHLFDVFIFTVQELLGHGCHLTVILMITMQVFQAFDHASCVALYHHFCDFGTKPEDYDKIITGDLGYVGQEILIKLLLDKGYDISGVHTDCGIEIFDRQTQGTDSGGSGCGCAAVTLSAHFLKKIAQGEWKKILFVPTGALLSTVSFNEGQNVPGIAHAVVIEHEE